MNRTTDNSEVKVLKRLLAACDAGSTQAPGSHLSDDTLALFAEGALSGAERDAAVAHLAACPTCRHVAALLLQEDCEPVVLRPSRSWLTAQVASWAVAASLLVGVSAVVLIHDAQQAGPGPAQVAHGEHTRPAVAQPAGAPPATRVAKSGSDQSEVRPPASARPPENALAGGPSGNYLDRAGRLSDYGYGFDGRLTREFRDPFAGQIKELEALPEGDDLKALCNRGQRLLAWGRAKDSAEVFAQATKDFPRSEAAWLGAGLAAFIEKDVAAAVQDFRAAVALNPQSRAARINLAIALQAQGERAAALELWKQLLDEKLSPADEQQIREQIQALDGGAKQ